MRMAGIEFNRRGLFAAGAVGAGGLVLSGCSTPADATSTAGLPGGPGGTVDGLPNTSSNATVDLLADTKIVPVLRDPTPDRAMATARAWVEGGCRAIELTTTTPDVFHVAAMLAKDGVTVGVGTMRTVDHIQMAKEAGASFVPSFATWPQLIETASSLGLVPVPGTSTPTEVFASLAAPMIKIFPARILGLDYLETLRVLFPGIRTQVTGGVGLTPADARAWLAAGATIVAPPGDLLGRVEEIGAAALSQRVRQYRTAVGAP